MDHLHNIDLRVQASSIEIRQALATRIHVDYTYIFTIFSWAGPLFSIHGQYIEVLLLLYWLRELPLLPVL